MVNPIPPHAKYLVVLAVAAFIVSPENEILIVKKIPGSHIDAGLWTIPGGKVEPDEGLITALIREVKEEVGFQIKNWNFIGEDVFLHGENSYYYHGLHFYCRVPNKPVVELEPGAFTDFAWVTHDKVKNYEFHPNILREIENVFRLVS
ncbi:MAG: NUDIX hydrolase [Candidatus Saccharimonadia bacterium]